MDIDSLGKIIWDYMLMNQLLEKADAIFVLGSSDTRIAEYAATLFLESWAPLLILSGNTGAKGRSRELWGMSEAEKFATIAKDMGVPETAMILEKKSTNTGENIQFTKKLLAEMGILPHRLILVQKPYMERRTFATFAKQWPNVNFIVSSPPVSFEEYPTQERPKDFLINMMIGDYSELKNIQQKDSKLNRTYQGKFGMHTTSSSSRVSIRTCSNKRLFQFQSPVEGN